MKKPKPKNALMTMPAATMGPSHDDEMKWKARDAVDTLKRAHEIKNDSHLMSYVHKHAQAEKEALGKIIRRKT